MSEDRTPRLALPVLHIGQAGKEQTHNEALALIDMVVSAAVEDAGMVVPPPNPTPGQCWIVGPEPSGAWTGNAHAIAGWTEGGWRFVAPTLGLTAWHKVRQVHMTFGDRWDAGIIHADRIMIGGEQVVSARQPVISEPAGGGVIDVEARSAVTSVIATLRAHGLIG